MRPVSAAIKEPGLTLQRRIAMLQIITIGQRDLPCSQSKASIIGEGRRHEIAAVRAGRPREARDAR